MTVEEYRDFWQRRPFQPFRVVMSNGEAFQILRPEMCWLAKTYIVVGVGETEEGVPAEGRIFSLESISDVEPLNSAASGSTP
jgi:hypothetical protein